MKNKLKGILCCALVVFVVTGCTNNNIYNQVAIASEEINKRCPMVVDTDTRLDNTAAMDNPVTLIYNYTIVTFSKAEIEGEIASVKEEMKKSLQNMVETSPDMKFFRDNRIPLKYSYKDKDGVFVFDFTITAGDKSAK